MMRILITTAAAALFVVAVGGAPQASATEHRPHHEVVITGAVTSPARYAADEIAAQPQVTLPDLRPSRHPGDLTGALLLPLVTSAGPVTPDVKNAQLRVTVTVSGRGQARVAFSLAELDPSSGNHPALLVTSRCSRGRGAGVDLVVPGDSSSRRTVRDVSRVQVEVAAPRLPADVPAGALQVVDGHRTVIVSAATLSALPVQTRIVNFQSGKGPQTHTEAGPTLAAVLRAAHIRVTPSTVVAAIADDGYVATVTPAEATSGRRVLLLSTVEDGIALAQPRLVPDGDVFGGRYVSGVLALNITDGDRHH